MRRRQTPSQTVGPFFSMQLVWDDSHVVAEARVEGVRVELGGRVLDGDGEPVGDALIEVWQADPRGRYRVPSVARGETPEADGFRGFGRAETDRATGAWALKTVKPGRVPASDGGLQAPHLNVIVLARGLLEHLFTRVYFADEPSNAEDAVLAAVPAERRPTLLATPLAGGGGAVRYRWDVRLQGAGETVFFDV